MQFRRALARRVLRRSKACWPILETAGAAPEGWPGWPAQKKFALVLTHDVEGQKGVDRTLELAELEASLGFKSSFNFVPEGSYRTPRQLREALISRGFEVGVHDWRHDGKLYRSEKTFCAAAERINKYLEEWNATGFRSGFMHHNLEWLHYLDIAYDMSTFDTDPFEPQPDGVHTIFPFWVPASEAAQERDGAGGYAELPYTLPQDSTVYLLLEQTDPNIWKTKLDWIVKNRGMALVNVHPDYIAFDGAPKLGEYRASIYRDFLNYVLAAYRDEFWLALPSEVATYVRENVAIQSIGGRALEAGERRMKLPLAV
jgi:peptidoglycan/xylan/chitin deacetylase (PgdA/CDA1 family)